MWCPQAIHPGKPIWNKAIIIESLPDIEHWLYFIEASDVKPEAGNIGIWTSGCPEDRNECWDDNTSPPLIGSERLLLKCLSYIIVVIRPAGTGNGGVGNKGVKNIGQPNRAEKNIE